MSLVLKIAAGIIVAVVVLAVGCSVLVASGTEDANQRLAELQQQASIELEQEEQARADRVSWDWVDDPHCGPYSDGCWQIEVTANEPCSDGLYGEVNLLDESGTTIDYTNDSLGRLDAGRTAILTFQRHNNQAVRAEVAKVECY